MSNTRTAFLYCHIKDLDIVIFCLNDGQRDWDFCIRREDLDSTNKYLHQDAWTVGYASQDKSEWEKYLLKHFNLLSPEQQDTMKEVQVIMIPMRKKQFVCYLLTKLF